jgi:hypothetical protein
LPVPASIGVPEGPYVTNRPADDEYGGALAATDEPVESSVARPSGAGMAALTAGVVGA